jgi:hypothetical protein
VVGVGRRVERDDLVAHRDRVAMRIDQLADIVGLEQHGESGEWPGHRHAGRKGRRVAEDSQCLVVTRHHDDVVMWFAAHRALASQRRQVRVWVVDELAVPEEILRFNVAHRVIAPLRVLVDRKGTGFTNG